MSQPSADSPAHRRSQPRTKRGERKLLKQLRADLPRLRAALTLPIANPEQLPSGTAILACNYASLMDAMRVRGALPTHVTMLIPPAQLRRVAARRIPTPAQQEQQALQQLAAGGQVVVFPEGGPSRDGALHRGEPEVARLALRARAPIVPIATTTAGKELVIGEAIDVARFADLEPGSPVLDAAVMRVITDSVMVAIAALSGQRYVDISVQQAEMQEVAAALAAQEHAEQRYAWLQAEYDRLRDEAVAQDEEQEAELLAAVEAARQQAQQAAAADAARKAKRRGER